VKFKKILCHLLSIELKAWNSFHLSVVSRYLKIRLKLEKCKCI
jgi:hypothetical protein